MKEKKALSSFPPHLEEGPFLIHGAKLVAMPADDGLAGGGEGGVLL